MTYGFHRGVTLLAIVASLFLVTRAVAAPDEEALGKAEGYPVCPPLMRNETRCLVGLVSGFDGRQIIPADWVRAATTPPAKQFEPGWTNSLLGYGYQTWIVPGKARQFMLRGLRGQAVLVDPSAKVVMVHTAAGGVGGPGLGEIIALWSAVVETFGK